MHGSDRKCFAPDLYVRVSTNDQQTIATLWSHRRNFLPVLSMISAPLFWIGMRRSSSSDLARFLAFNCIFVALRFLLWDSGLKHSEPERRKRLEAHRKMERGDA